MKERKRRLKLPVPKHDIQISLWRTLKSFVGKDLTKVAIPVHFNEPLTFLQVFEHFILITFLQVFEHFISITSIQVVIHFIFYSYMLLFQLVFC